MSTAGIAAASFCWGRSGAVPEATATPPQATARSKGEAAPANPQTTYDSSQRVVAYIYNTIPITREELGEYLITRHGTEKLEMLVNERIIERACNLRRVRRLEILSSPASPLLDTEEGHLR